MVDLALLQSVSYIAGALGVCIAAIFYVLNLRISQKNQELSLRALEQSAKAQQQTLETRKLQFVTSITSQLLSEEGQRKSFELLNMEWKDYDDFERKYGSDNNLDNAAKRISVWYTYDTLGMLVREKLIEPEILFPISSNACFIWSKFKDIIPEWVKRYGVEGVTLSGWEFLNNELMKIILSKDPNYKVPETLSRYVPEK